MILPNGPWSTKYIIDKNTKYSASSTDWTFLNLDHTEPKYGNKLDYDQIDATLADKCFSKSLITLSAYKMDHVNYFKEMFESIPDYKKIKLLSFLIKNDVGFMKERGFF